jgi:hypothetical protein
MRTAAILRFLAFAAVVVTASSRGALASERWFLDSCSAANEAKADSVRAEVLSAAPGSSVYVPRPFPLTEEQVVEDLVFQLSELWSQDDSREVPRDILSILSALKRKATRFDIREFVDWRSARCGPVYGQTDYRFLVRVFSVPEEEELGRFVVNNTGLLATFVTPRQAAGGHDESFGAIESIDDLRSRSAIAANAVDFQYVALSGYGLSCSDVRPCIAFRAAGRAYISRDGRTYGLDLERSGLAGVSPREVALETSKKTATERALRPGEHLVTLGWNVLAVASPIPEK